MNNKRILAGGLVAGLVLNVGETILNVPVIGPQFDAALQALGAPAMAGSTIGLFVVMCFLLGILAVWVYAAMRPRLGAGPGSALMVGFVVYLLAFVFPGVGTIGMGILPARLIGIALLWELFEVPLAVLAGAWVYREEAVTVAAAAAAR